MLPGGADSQGVDEVGRARDGRHVMGRRQEAQVMGQRIEVRVADHVAKEERTTWCARHRRRIEEIERRVESRGGRQMQGNIVYSRAILSPKPWK